MCVSVGSDDFVAAWLAALLAKARSFAALIRTAAVEAGADLSAAQACSQLVRQCLPTQHAHLARLLWSDTSRSLPAEVDVLTTETYAAVNALPSMEAWQEQLLAEPINAG